MPSKKPLEAMHWAEALWTMYGGESPTKIVGTLKYGGKEPKLLWFSTASSGFSFYGRIVSYGLGWIKAERRYADQKRDHIILTREHVANVVASIESPPPDEAA